MIENVKRQKQGIVVALAIVGGIWWTVGFHLYEPQIDLVWKGVAGTAFAALSVAYDVLKDWYTNPATAVDDWEEAELE